MQQRPKLYNNTKALNITMPIVMYLGANVNEYKSLSMDIIMQQIIKGNIRCDICTDPMGRHSSYSRSIKETDEELDITIVRCKVCNKGHALLPDFLSPYKHYSGNEIESVIIDSATTSVDCIETEASESTVRRWISQVGERIVRAVSILKYLFNKDGRTVSELNIDSGTAYDELEQLLEFSPLALKHCGNRLGHANIWLGRHSRYAYI